MADPVAAAILPAWVLQTVQDFNRFLATQPGAKGRFEVIQGPGGDVHHVRFEYVLHRPVSRG